MKCKFSLLLFLCVLSLWGQAQSLNLQELVNKKQFQEVVARADSLTPADSADYATMSAIGQAYEGLLRYKEAYQCFSHCLKMDTNNVDALNAVARNAINFGRIAEAKQCYRKVLGTDSMNFYANYQLARLYYQLGDYGRATEHYHILASIEGENPSILTGLADCHIKRGTGPNTMIALSLYARALELNPENVRVASSLINTLLRMGDGQGALQVCDTALFYNPDNSQIRQSKGMALYMTKDYKQADSVYTGLLADGDSSFLNLKYAGAARYMSGHALDGVELLEKAYEIDSTDVETVMLYGASLGKTYDRKRAYELFDLAETNMQPKKFLVNMLTTFRGDALERDGRWPEAEKLYYAAWKEDPTQLHFLYKISTQYWDVDPGLFQQEEKLQKTIFSRYTYLTAYMKTDKSQKYLYNYRPFLEAVCEDAFFRNADEVTMLAPDGKKTKLAVADLRALVAQLPQMPEDERLRREKMQEHIKKAREKEKELRKSGAKLDTLALSKEEKEKAKMKLPAVTWNGTFKTKNRSDLIHYSSFTALDFDHIQPEKMDEFGKWLQGFSCVYAYYITPSGKGYKAIILHDNYEPLYHYDLYNQLLELFDCPEKDTSTVDLARGNFLSYDPNLWKNPDPEPFHFVPSTSEPIIPETVTETIIRDEAGNEMITEDDSYVAKFLNTLSRQVVSDDSIIRILGKIWTGKSIANGRNNTTMSYAGVLCKAGVEKNRAKSFIEELVPDYDITEIIEYAYSHNTFGCERRKYKSRKK